MKITASLLAAAKELNRRYSAMCEVDADDSWNVNGEDFIKDAEATLEAAGFNDMLAALQMVRDYVVTMKGAGHEYQIVIDAALKKATTGDAA